MSNIRQEFSNGNWFGAVFNAGNLKVAKDILLKKVVGYNQFGNTDWVELNYKSEVRKAPMLDFNDPDVHREDSLYSYKTVYNSDIETFNNWKRYYHVAHDSHPALGGSPLGDPANGLVSEISSTNPYARIISGAIGFKERYNRANVPNTNLTALPFDHCFLESDRLDDQELWLPGELYKIKTKLSGPFCNYDINIVSGPNSTGSYGDELTPQLYEGRNIQQGIHGPASERIFSTFNSAVKWNPAGSSVFGGSNIITSNLFTMPNLPSSYDGYFIQVGPANSDHIFNLSENLAFNSSYFTAFNAYNKREYTRSVYPTGSPGVPHQYIPTYYDNIPQNFGIGMPWFLMCDIYSDLTGGSADKNNPQFRKWFKRTNTASNEAAYNNILNEPTLAGNGTLSDVEIIRYSKNPYMLSEVRTYKASGEVNAYSKEGFTLTKRVKLDYTIEDNLIADNQEYLQNATIWNNVNKQHHYLLSSIQYMPTDPSGTNDNYDTTITPNTFMAYSKLTPTHYDDNSGLIGSIWVMDQVENSLGMTKELKYFPIPDSMHFNKLYKMSDGEIASYYGQSSHSKGSSMALEVRPIVKKVTTHIEGGNTRDRKYEYSWSQKASNGYGKQLLNSDFYSKASGGDFSGFYQTTVKEPLLNNAKNYSVFTHFSGTNVNGNLPQTAVSKKMGGKVKKVQRFNSNGELIKETEYEYLKILAYEGGFNRPDDDQQYWDFDYMDFYFRDTPGASLSALQGRGSAIRVGFPNDVKYYEQEYSSVLTNYNSYFINVASKSEKEYDPNGCVVNQVQTEPGPITEEFNQSSETDNYVNLVSYEEQLFLIDEINQSEEFESVENTLIENSPLADTVLESCLKKNAFQEQTDFQNLLNIQGRLSDKILEIMLSEPLLLENKVFNNYSREAEIAFTEQVLSQAIDQAEHIDGSLLETLLKRSKPLSDSILVKLINTEEALPQSSIEAILTHEDSLSEQTRLALLGNGTNLSAERIYNVLSAHEPFPGDSVLKTFINNHIDNSTQLVIDFINSSPGSHSSEIESLIQSNADLIPENDLNIFNAFQIDKPLGNISCYGGLTNQQLVMEQITEYDYYTANFTGYTYADGFKDLLDLDQDSIQLKYEPSWQVYKVKTYSPQFPNAYQEKRKYYYFDLKNRFDRHFENYKNTMDGSGTQWLTQTLSLSNGLYSRILTDGLGNLELPEPDGMLAAYKSEIRNIAYQEKTISDKRQSNSPYEKSTYYLYHSRWPQDENFKTTSQRTVPPDPSIDCQADQCELDINIIPSGDLGFDRFSGEIIFPVLDSYSEIYTFRENDIDYYFYIDSRKDCVYPPETLLVRQSAYDRGITQDPTTEFNANLNYDFVKGGVMFLKSIFEQIDTVETYKYAASQEMYNIPSIFGNTKLMSFENIGFILPNPLDPSLSIIYDTDFYAPYFPYSTIKKQEVISRNPYSLPTLIENSSGLRTAYNYDGVEIISEVENICGYNWDAFVNFGNLDKPNSIEVYPKDDDTDPHVYSYEYYPDLSTKTVTSANGSEVEYRYNEYGQIKEERSEGELITKYNYGFWNGDQNKTFEERTADNYIETIIFPNDSISEASISRKYIDPIGRDYQTVNAKLENGLNSSTFNKAQFTGLVTYNSKDQIIEQERAFEFNDDPNPIDLRPRVESHDLIEYPRVKQYTNYENGWQGRQLEFAQMGESLGGSHNQLYDYGMMNSYCFACDLSLSAFELNQIMPEGIGKPYVFKKVTLTDEDGKTHSTYSNAQGQTVAEKQVNGGNNIVTLFTYNKQGLKEKVINPKNQISYYFYNILGWPYRTITPDGGVKHMMYNKQGQVTWEQDELALAGREDVGGVNRPYLKHYEYDEYGRLTAKGEAFYGNFNTPVAGNLNPLDFQSQEVGDPNLIDASNSYFYNKFSNRSTYDWLSQVKVNKLVVHSDGSTSWNLDTTLYTNAIEVVYFNTKYLYDGRVFNSPIFQAANNTLKSAINFSYQSSELSLTARFSDKQMQSNRPITSLSLYSYDSKGRLNRLLNQFNPNGISSTTPGLVIIQELSKFNNLGQARQHDVDINADTKLDYQQYKVFDYKGRLKRVYANVNDLGPNGHLVASFAYDDVFNRVEKKRLFLTEIFTANNLNHLADEVQYNYDLRNRLTETNSGFLDYQLFYDSNQPSLNGLTPNGDLNYNGNINGIKATYKIGSQVSNFSAPTVYNYSYDNLNRLTAADAIVGDIVTNATVGDPEFNMGDASFSYDKIGNISQLQRTIDGTNNLQAWDFNYQAGTNKLNQAGGLSGTSNRNYTYDVNGNLFSDDSREISSIRYNTDNLPVRLERQQNGLAYNISYGYNTNQQRILKLFYEKSITSSFFVNAKDANYYLYGPNGKTIGIVDFNTEEWTWYVNHNERLATFTPEKQPVWFNASFANWDDISISEGGQLDQMQSALSDYMQSENPGVEELLFLRNTAEEQSAPFWTTQTEVNIQLNENPELEDQFNIEQRLSINSPKSVILINNDETGETIMTSVESIYEQDDSDTLVDNSTFWADRMVDGGPGEDWDDEPVEIGKSIPIQFYRYDHLGNSRITYEVSWDMGLDTDIQGVYDYFPYGKILRSYISGNGFERYLTTQHERDHETISENTGGTGLDYRFARFSDSDVPRFLQIDPHASDYPGWSPYAYVLGNPISFIDPDGKNAWKPEVDDDGNTSYVAEAGDNGMTLKEQYGLSTTETAQILVKNGFDKSAVNHIDEGTKISGESVKGVTGNDILSLDMNSNSLSNADVNRQLAFAINKTNASGNSIGNLNSFFSNWKGYSMERAGGYQHGITTSHSYPTNVSLGGQNARISSSIGTHHNGLFLSNPSPDRQLQNGRRASDYFHPNSLERSGSSIPAFTIYKH